MVKFENQTKINDIGKSIKKLMASSKLMASGAKKSSDQADLSNIIKTMRQSFKMTFKDLSSILGCSEATLTRWEKGTVIIDALQAKRIKWLEHVIGKSVTDRVDPLALKHVLNHYSIDIIILLLYNSGLIPKLPEDYDNGDFIASFYEGFRPSKLLLPNLLNKLNNLQLEEIEEIKKIINDKPDEINAQNFLGQTALMIATEKKFTGITQMLLQKGADVKVTDRYKRSALHFALFKDDSGFEKTYEIVNQLIRYGADVNVPDFIEQSPLLLAAHNYDFVEVVETLINAGADIDFFPKGSVHCPPLMAAIINKNVRVALYLIDKGAKLNIQAQDGLAALHCAVFISNIPVIKSLLDKNVDVNIKDNEGNTALDYAKATEQPEIIELLSTHKRGEL